MQLRKKAILWTRGQGRRGALSSCVHKHPSTMAGVFKPRVHATVERLHQPLNIRAFEYSYSSPHPRESSTRHSQVINDSRLSSAWAILYICVICVQCVCKIYICIISPSLDVLSRGTAPGGSTATAPGGGAFEPVYTCTVGIINVSVHVDFDLTKTTITSARNVTNEYGKYSCTRGRLHICTLHARSYKPQIFKYCRCDVITHNHFTHYDFRGQSQLGHTLICVGVDKLKP